MPSDDSLDTGNVQSYGGDPGELCDLSQREYGAREDGEPYSDDGSLRYLSSDHGVDSGHNESHRHYSRNLRDLP